MAELSRRAFTVGAGAALGMGLFGGLANSASMVEAVEVYFAQDVAVRRYRPLVPNGRPAIVMVHGGAHAGWAWDRYGQYFAGLGWDCHALDWYNHGLSPSLPTQQFIARSITDVFREIWLVASRLQSQGRPYLLMGHSMGGLAALWSAQVLHPQALVLITPVVPAQVGAAPIPIPVDFTVPFPVPPFEVAKGMFFSTMSDAEASVYYHLLQPESPRAVYEATRWTVSVNLGAVTAPAMTVAAAADTLTPPAAVHRLAELLHCRHVDFPAIGHSDVLLKAQGWLPVAQDIEHWLRTV